VGSNKLLVLAFFLPYQLAKILVKGGSRDTIFQIVCGAVFVIYHPTPVLQQQEIKKLVSSNFELLVKVVFKRNSSSGLRYKKIHYSNKKSRENVSRFEKTRYNVFWKKNAYYFRRYIGNGIPCYLDQLILHTKKLKKNKTKVPLDLKKLSKNPPSH